MLVHAGLSVSSVGTAQMELPPRPAAVCPCHARSCLLRCSLEDLLKPELRASPKYACLDLNRVARVLDK